MALSVTETMKIGPLVQKTEMPYNFRYNGLKPIKLGMNDADIPTPELQYPGQIK